MIDPFCDDEYATDYTPIWAALATGVFALAATVAPKLMKARAVERERRDALLVAASKVEVREEDDETPPTREEFQEWIRQAVKEEMAGKKSKRKRGAS